MKYDPRHRWHLLDNRAGFPEPLCAQSGVLTERISADASVVSCPHCIADDHFPMSARLAIRGSFSFIDREVEEVIQARALGRLAAAQQIAAQPGGESFLKTSLSEREQQLMAAAAARQAEVARMMSDHAEISTAYARIEKPQVEETKPSRLQELMEDLRGRERVTYHPINTNVGTIPQSKESASVMSRIGEIIATSAKRGLAAGTIRAITKRVVAKLEQRYPMIGLMPLELQNLIVCSIVHMVATGAADKPGMSALVTGAEFALEGLMTSAVATAIEEVMDVMANEVEALKFDAPPKELGG